ncbi:hypothetical protein KQ939_08525 [Planococcus sp. CP5-4]|uniref:hypothetical protein n=1 Tax=unclassified Planococcus (in: firmicutes) TaxID=2662419 RepID=UPI001C2108C4|nr:MULTISPECIES: hypothetical protein [unclassified Planococcus (in: firmicutes)]MBU9674264.1 hypothetical protein [Planococcus sp. CP5-4_YE]MBV0909264.1 hypothetical protein [Planococcus sp. CP5-4_UN]MBW6063756.1 hypothetical protein [Planococcus sp. CP5-4]
MKLICQAVAGAIMVHLLYWVVTFMVGYAKTMLYHPNIGALWANEHVLQSEVSFGYTVSPIGYMASFFATAMLFWCLLALYKKFASKPSW